MWWTVLPPSLLSLMFPYLPFVISLKTVTTQLLASVQNLAFNCTSQFNCQ